MKVLLIQENGRHDANRKFRECFTLQRSFQKLGHEADVWGFNHENWDWGENINFNDYDFIINLENYPETAGNWIPDFSDVDAIKFLWSIDSHCRGTEYFENEFKRGKYHKLMHSTKDFVTDDHHIWFPNGFDDELIKKMDVEKKHKFGFCGNLANRGEILERLKERVGLKVDVFVIGDEMVKTLNEYECHFNQNIAWGKFAEMNYRNFETIGCGTLLLTSGNEVYEELGFKDGENCFIYNSLEELYEKVDYIMNNDVSHVAEAGYELSKKHTYTKRVEELLKEFDLVNSSLQ